MRGRLLTQRLDWRRAWRTSRASCTRRSRRRRGPQAGTMTSTSTTPWTRSSMSPPSTSGAWGPASERPMRPCGGQPCQLCALNRSAAHTAAETIPCSRVPAARAQPSSQQGRPHACQRRGWPRPGKVICALCQQPHLSRQPRLPKLLYIAATSSLCQLHGAPAAQQRDGPSSSLHCPPLISQSCREECVPGGWSPASLCYMRDVKGGSLLCYGRGRACLMAYV